MGVEGRRPHRRSPESPLSLPLTPAGAVRLTFDDGPDPDSTPLVLTALERAGASATFFVMAPKARAHPLLVRAMRRAGHRVQLHCGRHLRHTRVTREEVARDTDDAVATLGDLDVSPDLWRTPWGARASWTEQLAAERGLALYDWSADTRDWHGEPASWLLARVAPDLRAGAVVLMHDGVGPGARRADCSETARMVGPLVELSRSRGLEPATAGAPA